MSTRWWVVAIGALLALILCMLASAEAGEASPKTRARASSTISVNDTGHLHFTHASGSLLVEEGPVSGTLPGKANVRLNVSATVTASFTIEARGGDKIIGRGSATLHSSGIYSSFGGSLSVGRGTGRYAHARGSGKLYGLINRRTHALTVQTTGTLHY